MTITAKQKLQVLPCRNNAGSPAQSDGAFAFASESPGYTKSISNQAIVCRLPITSRRTHRVGRIVEGCATHNTETAVSARPCGSVARIAAVRLVPAILRPVPDIAVHVIKTPGIGQKAVHHNGCIAPLAERTASIGNASVVVGLVGRNRIAPPEGSG